MDKLTRRHCYYYGGNKIKHKEILDINKAPKEKYDENYKIRNTHIGQRKLLMSEIQVINTFYDEFKGVDPIILYIGAAPGTHLVLLHEMFPKVKFILYDGAKFDIILKKYKHAFELHTQFVDNRLISKLKHSRFNNKDIDRLILISDIRMANKDRDKFEIAVNKDMLLQQEWVKILKPAFSLLKFRLPYYYSSNNKYKYLKGDIYYQVWEPKKSTETRLLVRKADIDRYKRYDIKKYEDANFYHNKYERAYCYDIKEIDEDIRPYIYTENKYCPCYDCIGELKILHKYCKLMNKNLGDIISDVNKICKNIFPNIHLQPELKKL